MKETKLQRMLFILQELHHRPDHMIDSYDALLAEEFGLSPKQIGRLLDEISEEIDHIEMIKIGRKKAYQMRKPLDIFIEAFEHSTEISWLFNMAHDADPEIFKELEQYTNTNRHVYQFKNTPFEDTQTLESKETFKRLKKAVERREYRKIHFKGAEEPRDNLKCLKLIFMDSNWYIAYVTPEDQLRFGRVSFIERVEYASNKSSFQPSSVQKQMEFLESVQNSMTLYDKPKRVATLKARPFIAKYFDEGMKPFLSSQKFVKKLDDGSILFTVEFTQPMEVLPFIQGWLPNMIIIEPEDLRDDYKNRLGFMLDNHG